MNADNYCHATYIQGGTKTGNLFSNVQDRKPRLCNLCAAYLCT